jgi:DNA-binding GntR family transcriptional regulator
MTYKSKSDIVFDRIKEMIALGELPPEETFSAVDVAERIGFSRTPVNEAIKRLAERSLVRILPNVGFVATAPSLDDLQELMEIKHQLELLALDRMERKHIVPKVDPLREKLKDIRAAIKHADRNQYGSASREFHFAFIALAESPPLVNMYSMAWDYQGNANTRFLDISKDLEALCQDHRVLIEDIEQSRYDHARTVLGLHRNHMELLLEKAIGHTDAIKT